MIVHTMTEKEIEKEVLNDMFNAFRWEDKNHNKFRRLVLKSSRFPIYFYHVYDSPKKNRWLILMEARNRKEIGDNSRVTYVTTYNSPHGVYAIMVSFVNKNSQLVFFPPHFFKRFRERTGRKDTGMKLLINYFRHNSGFVYDTVITSVGNDNYITEIAGSTRDGVALGILSIHNNVLFKTFVTYDMLQGEQIEKYTQNEKIRKEIHN